MAMLRAARSAPTWPSALACVSSEKSVAAVTKTIASGPAWLVHARALVARAAPTRR